MEQVNCTNKGCTNTTRSGKFHGDFCYPCYRYIVGFSGGDTRYTKKAMEWLRAYVNRPIKTI